MLESRRHEIIMRVKECHEADSRCREHWPKPALFEMRTIMRREQWPRRRVSCLSGVWGGGDGGGGEYRVRRRCGGWCFSWDLEEKEMEPDFQTLSFGIEEIVYVFFVDLQKRALNCVFYGSFVRSDVGEDMSARTRDNS